MARPKIFVSSTYYDLKYIRDDLEEFIRSYNYDPVLFEKGNIPFAHNVRLEDSCYAEVKQHCTIFILIVGGRFGTSSAHQNKADDDEPKVVNSIVKNEYHTARDRGIPIYIFVDKNVLTEFRTYESNKDIPGIKYVSVDNPQVFKLLEDIFAQGANNLVRGFERFEDISHWLREQWAGLFEKLISKQSISPELKDLSAQVAELKQISNALKEYSEVILRKLQPPQYEEIIVEQEQKLEEGRIKAFANEDLIEHVVRNSVSGKTSPERLYQMFRDTDSFEAFLKETGVSASHLLNLLSIPSAQKNYAHIRERYFTKPKS